MAPPEHGGGGPPTGTADHPGQPECIGKHGPDNPCDGIRGKHPAVKWGTWAVEVTPQMIDLVWENRDGLANVAVACGPSNLVVLDEDASGELDRWCVTYDVTLPDTYTVTTGQGAAPVLPVGPHRAADR